MSKTTKRVRSRKGYVMVELSPMERAKLEQLRDKFSAESGIRWNLSGVLRHLLHQAKFWDVS